MAQELKQIPKGAKAEWVFNQGQAVISISLADTTSEDHLVSFAAFNKKANDYQSRPGKLLTAIWQAGKAGILNGINPVALFNRIVPAQEVLSVLRSKSIRSDMANVFATGDIDSALMLDGQVLYSFVPSSQISNQLSPPQAAVANPVNAPPPQFPPQAGRRERSGNQAQANAFQLQQQQAPAIIMTYELEDGVVAISDFHNTGLSDSVFIYSKFSAEDAWEKVQFEFDQKDELLENLCAFAIVVGRLTSKKKQHLALFSADQNTLTNNDVELRNLILRFDQGGKIQGYNLSQIVSVALPRFYRSVMRIRQVVSYVKGGAQSESYSLSNKVETFDFASWLPISQSQLETHLAVRFFRAVSLEGYVVPDPSVSLRQVNYSRKVNTLDEIFLDMGNVKAKFDILAGEHKSAFIGVPLEKLTFGLNRGERQTNTLMTAAANTSTSVRATNMIAAVKDITSRMPNRIQQG